MLVSINQKVMRYKHVCAYCGKEWEDRYKKKKYCGQVCMGLDRRGRRNPHWKGGSYVCEQGYMHLYMPDHPNAVATGYVKRSRYVMAKHLKRSLTEEEVVHHEDLDKLNDDISNLKLMNHSVHIKGHRVENPGVFASELNTGGRNLYRDHLNRQPDIKKNCAQCGKEFFCKIKTKKYCSAKCANTFYNKRKWEKNRRKNLRERQCEYCLEKFTPKQKNQKYCSDSCCDSAYYFRKKQRDSYFQ